MTNENMVITNRANTHTHNLNRSLYLPAWAKLKAQSRRYEAVFEIQPKQYSIVCIHWCTNISPKLNCKNNSYTQKDCHARQHKQHECR